MTNDEELLAAWRALDQRVGQLELAIPPAKRAPLSGVRKRMAWLAGGQLLQLVTGIVTMIVFGSFWFEHGDETSALVYGLLLHGYGLLLTVTAARSIQQVAQVDYAAPVVEIQRQIAALRVSRIRQVFWLSLAACVMWVPLLFVGLHALGVDVWRLAPQMVAWAVSSTLVGVAILLGLVACSRLPGAAWLARWLRATAAGTMLTEAERALQETVAFGRV